MILQCKCDALATKRIHTTARYGFGSLSLSPGMLPIVVVEVRRCHNVDCRVLAMELLQTSPSMDSLPARDEALGCHACLGALGPDETMGRTSVALSLSMIIMERGTSADCLMPIAEQSRRAMAKWSLGQKVGQMQWTSEYHWRGL